MKEDSRHLLVGKDMDNYLEAIQKCALPLYRTRRVVGPLSRCDTDPAHFPLYRQSNCLSFFLHR